MTDSGNTLNSAEVDFLLEGAGADDSPQGKGEPAADEQAVTMRGDLEQINLSDIYQTLAMTKMEGVLRVRNPLEQRQVYFHDGYVRILVPPRIATRRLGQRLVQAGLVQPEQLRAALVRQRKERQPIGQLLVAEGLLHQEQVDEIAGMQVGEDLFALFTWRHGTFEFWKGEIADADLRAQFDACPEFEVSSLLLEVARRSDEWESIFGAIGNLDEVPQRLGEVPADADTNEAARMLACGADGRTTYRELAEQTTLGLFEVARVARDLVRNGVLANVADADLVASAAAEADAGHHKRALMLLQTLRDRPGDRELDTVRAMVAVLEKAGERRLAGTLLLEVAQLQTDPEQALDLARSARDLSPHDAGTVSFLRTTLIAHSAPDSAELEQCTIDLLDALIEADRLDTAMEIVADARATGTMRPQILVREARARQKLHDPQQAAAVLFELAEIYQAAGDRAHTIETYEAILRLDRSRKDVQKQLRQLRQTRLGRIVHFAAASVCTVLLAAMGVVLWQQSRFDESVAEAGREIDEQLRAGNRPAAREALLHWIEVLGEGEQIDDLRRQVDFADAAEHTRLQRLVRKRMNERLALAAQKLGGGDLRAALAIYGDLHQKPDLRAEVAEVVAGRLEALLTEIEQASKTLYSRLPADPATVFDRKQLAANHGDLLALCRPQLVANCRELQALQQASSLPSYLAQPLVERIASVLATHRDVFERSAALTAAYAEAMQRASTERRLDPMFKQAVRLEASHDFAGALELYRQLELEPTGDAELRAHFRDQVARNATICRLMEALAKATAAGEFPVAQQQLRALKLAFPEVPFERLVRLPFRVESLPIGATVTCNGAEVGKTPCTLAVLPADENKVTVALPGFGVAHTLVTGDQTAAFRADLQLLPAFERKHDSAVEGPPAITTGDRLVLVDRSGDVVALDGRDGSLAWSFHSRDLSGLLSPPVLHGEHVLVASLDGELRALDRTTGTVAWSLPDLATELPPVRVEHVLLVAGPDRLAAIDLLEAKVVANTKLEVVPRHLLAHGSIVVVGGENGSIATFSLPGLTSMWRQNLAHFGEVRAAADSGALLVADERGHLAALEWATGVVRWQRTADSESHGNPIVLGDTVLLGTPQRALRFAVADGTDRPGITMVREPWAGPPTRAGSRILIPSRDGDVHVFDADRLTPIYAIEGSKRAPYVLPYGNGVMVSLPDRRLLFFPQLR